MKQLITLFFLTNVYLLSAQMPESNLVFRLDYDSSYQINFGETSFYDFQGGFLSEDRYGIENNACTFAGDKQLVKFEDFPCFEQELTISLWVKYESFQGERYPILLLSNLDEFIFGASRHIGFEVHNFTPALGYYNEMGGRLIYDSDYLSYNNDWHHLVGRVTESNLLELYIDNNYIGFQEFKSQTVEGLNQLIIGGGYSELFGHISIDDIRIYNRSLQICEIEALFLEKDMPVKCVILDVKECPTIVSTDIPKSKSLQAYPNPATNGVIKINTTLSKRFNLFNLLGEEVKRGNFVDGEISINDVPSGIYILMIDGTSQKIVIE